MAERLLLAEQREDAVAREPIGSIAVARVRKQLTDLDSDIATLSESRAVLLERHAEALRRETQARWAEQLAAADASARACVKEAADLQYDWDRLIKRSAALSERLLAWRDSLPRRSTELDDNALPAEVSTVLSLRAYAESEGRFRPCRVGYENAFQVRQSGRADLVLRVTEYTRIGLRGAAAVLEFDDPTRPRAA
ncbi:MAG TPA: hypothetical protein VES65_11285 [Solirubrobacteraceae bacterium]|nr:hypothetical protein [Solirubrobacteraceae bacterium]